MCHSQDATASATIVLIDSCSLPAVLLEDIVEEILLRLAIKPLFKFKCVSKRYESIISEPQFAKRYMRRGHSSSEKSSSLGLSRSLLFPYTGLYKDCPSKKFEDVCNTINSSTQCHGNEDNELSISVCSVSLPNDESGEILASSNGLILSAYYPHGTRLGRLSLHVYNPLTKQGVRIPQSTLNKYFDVGVGIATRQATMCGDQAAASSLFLTYKIVIIRRSLKGIRLADKANTSVEIFSSETGSWAAWELRGCPGEVFELGTVDEGFSYKGVLHWLCRNTGLVITYDPYNSPDRFGCISLPKKRYPRSDHKSLIFPGDQGVLKYCELGHIKPGVQRMWVWRLVDGTWCRESVFAFPSVPHFCRILMLPPNPWNPDIMCSPAMVGKKVTVLNFRTGRRRCVDVFDETKAPVPYPYNGANYICRLCPIDLCPWSSPFYAETT